jgi:protein-disulfide isomerase
MLKRFLLAATSLTLLASAAVAQEAPASKGSAPVTHDELAALVKDIIINDPDIIMEAVKKIHDKQVEKTKQEVKESFDKHSKELIADTTSPSLGDPKTADVTVIEFFDYHCGYCKHMLPAMTQLTNEDKKVRVIFREFPILSDDSVLAARAALAVNKLDKSKYFAYHTALMQSSGKFDEKMLGDLAKKQDIDPRKLKETMELPEITANLDQTRKIAEDLAIRGTPALLVGDQLLPGAVPYEDLKKIIDDTRKGVKPSVKFEGGNAEVPKAEKP